MNDNQRKAIQKLSPILIHQLDVDAIKLELAANHILTEYDVDVISNIAVAGERRQKFLSTIINKADSWNAFLIALDNAKQHHLRTELESEASAIPFSQIEFQKLVQELVPQLELYIKCEVEHIRRFWLDYLEMVKLKDNYQELEVFEIKGQKVQNETVTGYDFIWNDPSDRVFVIEGDPGIGKTTWMSKLALDWTNTTKTIRQKFNLLFLVPLRHLASPTFDGLMQYLFHILQEFDATKIANCLKEPKTLLLLDGFDENPSCIEWISKLTVNNGYRSKVVITSRGSHFDQIRKSEICDMRLVVKGFKEESIQGFFELQKCENSNELFANYSQLPEMCKVPMIAAILCFICKHDDVLKVITEDENRSLFIIFDNFVQMLLNMTLKKRSNLLDKRKYAMEEAGIFALDTVKSKNFLNHQCLFLKS